jgi:hypothetical protein
MSIPVAVIDTSVLVSNTNREHLVTAALENLYRPIWSPWIIAELNRVMTWNWVRNKGLKEREQCSRRYKDMMSVLAGAFTCVDPKPPWKQAWTELTDTDDLPIWSTAKFVGADYVVSANTGDFPPQDASGRHVWEGIEYIQVSEFLTRIGYEIE